MPRMHEPQTTRPATVPDADCAVAPCAASTRPANAAKAGTTNKRFLFLEDTVSPPYVENVPGAGNVPTAPPLEDGTPNESVSTVESAPRSAATRVPGRGPPTRPVARP